MLVAFLLQFIVELELMRVFVMEGHIGDAVGPMLGPMFEIEELIGELVTPC